MPSTTASRNLASNFVLPPNPTFVEFPRTDGKKAVWPHNTQRIVDHEGHVNFMEPLEIDTGVPVKWRVTVAEALAKALNWEEGKNYVLKDWPANYKMFDHHKGPQASPRHDVYLYGGPRFRSVPEFIPHAIWLFGTATATCNCKYCSGKPQREITQSMSNILSSPSRSSPSVRTASRRPSQKSRLRVEQQVYAAVQSVPLLLSATPSKHIAEDHAMVVERSQDLCAVNGPKTNMRLRRWYREGELLWCALNIEGLTGRDDAIQFWPCLVDEMNLRSTVIPGTKSEDPNSPGWDVVQSTKYKIKLIATSHMVTVDDHQVLPYQAYAPSEALIIAMRTILAHLDFSKEVLSNFHPFSKPAPSFKDAASAYALALQIGASLSSLWSLTDEWDFRYTIPASQSNSVRQEYMSLQAALNDAAGAPADSPTQPDMLGNRFQGLWWGAERIWTDDFVRLKIPRRALAPEGATKILPPAGPGPETLERCRQYSRPSEQFGAGARGVFMRLDALFIAELTADDGTSSKECRASGMLYELVDLDWVDPDAAPEAPAASVPAAASSTPGDYRLPSALPTADELSPNVQLSHPPLTSQFILPQPPSGYKFRPILTKGYECVLSLTLISGRYYPEILSHPLLATTMLQAETEIGEFGHLWSLEGLSPGFVNAVDPRKYLPNRLKMLEEADVISRNQLERHQRDSLKQEDEDDDMNIDI
ncbi:hypothetical protein C8J56DRAFT_972179 [Mycena floridula]|nr:hypothetical protein C8J56DRAFT_972179 [Mycena floridula]